MKQLKSIATVFILCLTLGLAPFSPEPHLWGKLKWIMGGAKGMILMDYIDAFMHGFPWILLFVLIAIRIKNGYFGNR